jgi:ATP-dependent helicase/nuclease subunit A
MAASTDLTRELEFVLEWPTTGAEADESALVTGYIDALYRDPQGRLHLVDYKTNDIPANGVAREAKQYELQMSLYALAVERALGEKVASLTLVFLRPGVEFGFEWDAAARERGGAMVGAAIEAAR